MECEFEATMSLYVDGELDEPGRALARAHMRNCESCRETVAAFVALRERAGAFEASGDPFVGRRVLASVLASGREPRRSFRALLRDAWVTLFALALAAGGYAAGRLAGPSPDGDPTARMTPETPPASPARPDDASEFLARYDRGGRAVIAVVPSGVREAGDGAGERR